MRNVAIYFKINPSHIFLLNLKTIIVKTIIRYFWGGHLASNVVRCCRLDISCADVKKDDCLMVTLKNIYKEDHSICVKTMEKQTFGVLVDVGAIKLYLFLLNHVYNREIDIVACANTDSNGSYLEVRIKFFTHFYEEGDPKLMAIERKMHTKFP